MQINQTIDDRENDVVISQCVTLHLVKSIYIDGAIVDLEAAALM